MKKTGILCASDTELEPFLKYIQSPRVTEKAMLKFYSGYIGRTAVVAVYSGVCKVNAAIAAQLLIDVFDVGCIINAGTAGGMDERVRLFDTVISERMVYHDVAEDILTEFPILFGTMVSGEQFIEDEKRSEINRKFAPLSVDMETVSIAHVCYVNNIPFLSVRTVTDTAEHKGIENFEQNCEVASGRSAQIVIGILEQYS